MRNEMMSLNNDEDHDYAWSYISYVKLSNPLYQHLRGARLRRLHVFRCWWDDLEAIVENRVMGLEYESNAKGKPSLTERYPRYPRIEGM